MKQSSKKSSILAILVSISIFYSCSNTPTTKEETKIVGPAKNRTNLEIVNVQGNFTSTSSSSIPTSTPTVAVTTSPSAIPSVVMPSINPVTPSIYMIQLSVKTGTATAYLTYTSNTYGRFLVNFKNMGDTPNKIQLLDQFGNVLNTSKTFNVSIAGNSVFSFYKQATQKVSKIQLFFVSGKMIEKIIDENLVSNGSEPTPIPPNPTPVPTPTIATNYPVTYIPTGAKVTTLAGSIAGYADGTGAFNSYLFSIKV